MASRRAVLFDYGLTLVSFTFPRDELLAVLEAHRQAIAHSLGRPAPDALHLLTTVLEPLEASLGTHELKEVDYLEVYRRAWLRAGFELPAGLLYQILDAEQLCWDRAVTLAPNALEVLDRLRSRGLRLGLASNAPFPPEMMRRQVTGNGIGQRMDAIVFSSEVGWRKPDGRLYTAALDQMEITPQEALYVGDRLVEDYDGPRQVGMAAVLCRGLARDAVPSEVPVIEDLGQLEALV